MLGFTKIAIHRSKKVYLYKQGDVNFVLNNEPGSFAHDFAQQHGPSVCAMGFRVKDAQSAYERALELGAKPFNSNPGFMELKLPAIEGIGGSVLYLIDRYEGIDIFDIDFIPIEGADMEANSAGFTFIDHLTHNVEFGTMDEWANFYINLFNFHQAKYFDIKGSFTGLLSRAMTSPDGKIKIPINESSDHASQINEFIREYNGPGIQHIALHTDNIYETVEKLHQKGVKFLNTPDAYYRMVDNRLPGHGEDVERMRVNRILIDGDPANDNGLLLQIFTETVIGPVFFEIIQRKGDEGFGEGNFQALFDSIEQDQIERGVINNA